jgi:hypothetical protein
MSRSEKDSPGDRQAWATCLAWGVVLDPGPAATNFGALTPLGSLMGHLVYGLVLGLTYDAWPLS